MIPDEAVEAAHRAICEDDLDECLEWRGKCVKAIEAAYPILLSHEREQTRLAHLDAMVNRETRRAELAEAWDAGLEATGDVPIAADYAINPYRSQE